MTKKAPQLLLCALAVVLTLVSGFSLPILSEYMPHVLNDVTIVSAHTDARKMKLYEKKEVYLAGEWEFFADKHIISESLTGAEPDLYVQVPSSWTTYEINGRKLSNGGKGSYRMYLTNVPEDADFVVYVPNIAGDCIVFVNGEKVYKNRSFATNTYRDRDNGAFIDVPLKRTAAGEEEWEIVIEMTCTYTSGLTAIPVASVYNNYQDRTVSHIAIRYMFIGIVSLFAIGSVILGIMRRDMESQLWLFVLCITFVLRMLVSHEGYLVSYELFGNMDYEIVTSLIYVSTYIIKLSMMMYINDVLNLRMNYKTIVFIAAIFLICAFVPYFLYDYIYIAKAYMWLQSVPYILDAVMIYKISGAIVRKRRSAILLLVNYCISAGAIIIDNYYMNGYISCNVSNVMPLACMVFISCMVMVHIMDTVYAYRESQRASELAVKLEEMNMTLMISQIQPHFLYNALNTIKYLIKKDPKTAESAVVKFSGYLRANMDSLTQKEPIPFSKEIDHVKNYVDIEMLRFGNRLNVEYDIQTESFRIPALTVQPIAENAIKHGINQKPEGGTLTISTREDEDSIRVIVKDNGVGFDVNSKPQDDGRSHVGLSNIKTRLKEMMNAHVTVESVIGTGTTVTVVIPKENALEGIADEFTEE